MNLPPLHLYQSLFRAFAEAFQPTSGLPLGIDVLVAESLDFDTLLREGVTITAWDFPIPIVSIDDLIAMKHQAGRSQDLLDVEHLLHRKA